MLASEEFAGPAKAGLDLIKYEDDIPLITEMSQAAQVFLLGHKYSSLPLYRLNDDGGRIIGHGPANSLHVVERDKGKLGHERFAVFAVMLLAIGGKGEARVPMIGLYRRNDMGASRGTAGKFDGTIDGVPAT